jgi:hypothetical protein
MLKNLRETDMNEYSPATITKDRDNNKHEETEKHVSYPPERIPQGS